MANFLLSFASHFSISVRLSSSYVSPHSRRKRKYVTLMDSNFDNAYPDFSLNAFPLGISAVSAVIVSIIIHKDTYVCIFGNYRTKFSYAHAFCSLMVGVKVKVKCSRYRPGVAQTVVRDIILLFHDRGTRRGEWSAARPGRALSPGKTRYQLHRRLGGPQCRSGRAENLAPTGIRSQTLQPVVSRYTNWATRPTNGRSIDINCQCEGWRNSHIRL